MTQAMQDLLVSYTRAVETEALLSDDGPGDGAADAGRWEKAKKLRAERRARLVDAIEKLEGELEESKERIRLISEAVWKETV